ncbi:MAG: STAS domain-containing protein [Acidimicrobiia bacterium]|jgi:anti-anti-sigma factor|nr:STAS domain-containing protein [Acidimicrobiia bacterium]
MSGSAGELALTADVVGTTTVIRPVGDLDMHAAQRLLDIVASHLVGMNRRIELDGSRLGFVDSAGLRSLVQAREAALAGDRSFAVVEASDALRKVLTITGLDGLLTT